MSGVQIGFEPVFHEPGADIQAAQARLRPISGGNLIRVALLVFLRAPIHE